jgi:asparagine synthase (glutamine-hydrolysing)
MCGFFGFVVDNQIEKKVLDECLDMLKHRGPDHASCKEIIEENLRIYFGHTRLAILDLSLSAAQPYESKCGNYSLIYNGEIYNFKEIKEELINCGYLFETTSDTEVLLYALIEWNTECLNKFIGMFSFAFYDKCKNLIILSRDAFGIKPLFYSLIDDELYFCSEIKPILKIQKKNEINLKKSYDYLVHGDYDSDDETFFKNIFHLPQSHFLIFDLKKRKISKPIRWWKPDIQTNHKISFTEASSKLRKMFLQNIKLHLRSDVPLGVALSGGIDSSSIASSIKYIDKHFKLNTFSFISDTKNISEEKWIDFLNTKLNAEINKIHIDKNDLTQELDELILKQGEPFSSTSIFAQYKVFREAKKKGVTVILDGQGADELLAGYIGYPGYKLISLIETKGLLMAHKFAINWSKNTGQNYFLAWGYFAKLLLPKFIYKILRKYMGRDFKPKWLNLNKFKLDNINFDEKRVQLKKIHKGNRVKEAMLNDLNLKGLKSLLRHADRNSMAHSVESRVPFLTIPLAEFLLSLPEEYLISNTGITKCIFRESMKGIVPKEILNRKDKVGFETPEYKWIISNQEMLLTKFKNFDYPEFLNKDIILSEFKKLIYNKAKYDKKYWRWINYLSWYNLIKQI